jgi:nucleoside-diphosphate-sugar epimerase
MAGWEVASQVRPGGALRVPRGTKAIETLDRVVLNEAARGTDVVVHALNPAYTNWPRLALPLAYSAIDLAEHAGATLMFPGNVYNYGVGMPAVLDEGTPMQPTTRKGQLRAEIEQRMREASERGVRTIILRAGDFFGSGQGSWFDLVLAKDRRRGIVTYPGPIDVVHAWAYLPDLATAFVRLAHLRERFGAFETFGFPGHAVTGREFVAALTKAAQRGLQIRRMPWWLIHLTRALIPVSRELSETGYLWQLPHHISGDKLKAAIGDIPQTPFEVAVARALRALAEPRLRAPP